MWCRAGSCGCLSICLSIYLSIYLSILLIYLSILLIYLSIYLCKFETKLFCETSSIFELDNIKNAAILRDFRNEAILRDFLQKWKVECGAGGLVPMRFAIFLFHSICVKCCAWHAKVMPGFTKCCACHAKSS